METKNYKDDLQIEMPREKRIKLSFPETDESDNNIVMEEEDVLTACDIALSIDIVLIKLFSKMEVTELKNCRLVCHQWKNLATKEMKKKVTIRFKYNSDIKDYEYWKWFTTGGDKVSPLKSVVKLVKQVEDSSDLPFDSIQFRYVPNWERLLDA